MDEKERSDTLIDLARLSHESLDKRRALEWKFIFGLFSSIAAVTYFFVDKMPARDKGQGHGDILLALGVAYFLIFLIYLFWTVRFHVSNWRDKAFRNFYKNRAERIAVTGHDIADYPYPLNADGKWRECTCETVKRQIVWIAGHVVLSIILLLGAWLIVFWNAG